jgi:hypothetical protein
MSWQAKGSSFEAVKRSVAEEVFSQKEALNDDFDHVKIGTEVSFVEEEAIEALRPAR